MQKQISLRGIKKLVYILLGVWCIANCLLYIPNIDNDFYFLAATGEEILQQGTVFRTNPFFLISDKPFEVQQWLWCIYCAWLSRFGNVGISISNTVQGIILFGLLYHLFRMKSCEKDKAFVFTAFSIWFARGYMINIRPEAITIILLVIQLIVTEQYAKTKRKWLLASYPLLMLLEINLHSSMWPFHFCILIPYLLPFHFIKGTSVQKAELPWVEFVLPIIGMLAATLVNPIGYHAPMFVVESFQMNTFEIFSSAEMEFALFGGALRSTFYLAAILVLYKLFVHQKLNAMETYMAVGLLALMIRYIKSLMFFPLFAVFFLPKAEAYLTDVITHCRMKQSFDEKGWTDKIVCSKAYQPVVILICVLTVGTGLFFSGKEAYYFVREAEFYTEILSCRIAVQNSFEAAKYIIDKSGTDAKVLTNFNDGGLFEFMGFRNVYLDARPESYAYPGTGTNGTDSILAEYAKLYEPLVRKDIMLQLQSLDSEIDYEQKTDEEEEAIIEDLLEKGKTYTDDEIAEILSCYDFDYLIVSKSARLRHYLDHHTDIYHEVDDTFYVIDENSRIDTIILYEKGDLS